MAIGQANGLDRCAQTEQHQHVHQHVHFTLEQLKRMTDEQLDRTEAAYTMLVALEQEMAADDAQRRRQHLLVPPGTHVRRIAPPARQR
jgi:hypothetical protein